LPVFVFLTGRRRFLTKCIRRGYEFFEPLSFDKNKFCILYGDSFVTVYMFIYQYTADPKEKFKFLVFPDDNVCLTELNYFFENNFC